MVGVSSLKTLWPHVLGVVSCLALRLFITRASLLSSSPRSGGSFSLAPRRRTSDSVLAWSCSFTKTPPFPTRQPRPASISIPIPFAAGGTAGPDARSLFRTIPARRRGHARVGPASGRRRRVEAEYGRGGALQYLAAWDVQEGLVMGLCEAKTGIEPFGRLVRHVMKRPEYASAHRAFWVVDNGSSHRGEASVKRMSRAYPNAILVHTPVHANWLNQLEVYFSLLQRKVLTPNDSADLQELAWRLKP